MFRDRLCKIRFAIGVYGVAFCLQSFADSTWVGTTSDLNTPTNWNPVGVPTSVDIANFDSTIAGVNTTPQSTLNFSVDSLNFLDSANAFTFLFNNCSLTLNGSGITGTNTNTTISIANANNPGSLATNLEFSNTSSDITSGEAQITITNRGAVSGSVSGTNLCEIGTSQLIVNHPFFVSDGGTISVSNSGQDLTSGSGNNDIGVTASQQVDFNDNVTVADHVTLGFTNSGLNGSTGSTSDVGVLEQGQLTVSGTFSAGDYLSFTVTNTGSDLSTGNGGNQTGSVNSSGLMNFGGNFIVGNNATILGSNRGTYGGTNAISGNHAGTEGGTSFNLVGSFQAGDNMRLTIQNTGTTLGAGTGVGGNRVGYNSGGQIAVGNEMALGKNASITCSNAGINQGTPIANGNLVAVIDQQQCNISRSLEALDNFTITLTNSGFNTSGGVGNHQVGYVAGQLQIGGTVNLGQQGSIFCTNSGRNIFAAPLNPSSIGYVGGDQLDIVGSFNAGDGFVLQVSNSGQDQNSGGNGSAIGYVNGSQAKFEGTCSVGDNATFTAQNTAVSLSTALNSVGVLSGSQLLFTGDFSSGKNLSIIAYNDAQISGGATDVGVVSGQINFNSQAILDDGAVITAYNYGVGTVIGSQIKLQKGFQILNGKIQLQALNEGSINGGYGIAVYDSLGGDANIVLQNSSFFVDTPHPTFTIGELNGDSTSFVQAKPELIIATDANVNADFSGDIQNFGLSASKLIKKGAGTQKLSGINTYTGLTKIEEGTLVVDGSLAGALKIQPGGTLQGTGSIAGNVTNLGVISPGESSGIIGPIHFLSNYTNNGGNYIVDINDAGQSDLIDVAGTATLNGGIILVNSAVGRYRFRERYTIVKAGSVVGTYTGAVSSSFIQPIVSYDAKHVYLLILADIASAAETPNQLAVALQLDSIIHPNAQQSLLLNTIVNLPEEEVRSGLDSLSGYQHAADFLTTQIINRQFIRRLYDPIRPIVTTETCCCDIDSPSCSPGLTGWFDVGRTFINFLSKQHIHGFHTQGYDLTGGVQATFCRDWTFGVAGSYEQNFLHFKEREGKERTSTWLAGLYGLYRHSSFYGFVDLAYGHSSNHLKRSIYVGNLHYEATSKPNTEQYTFYGEIGGDWTHGCLLLQPFFGVDVGCFHRKCVRESFAGGWGLAVNQRNRTLSTTRLGIHLTTNGFIDNQGSLSLDLAWNYLISNPKNHIHERFQEFGSAFDIEGTKWNRNGMDYALTFTSPIYQKLSGYIEAAGEVWTNANLFNIAAGIEFCW